MGNVEESEKTEEEPEEESALSQLTDWLKEKGGVVGTAVERERAAILIGQGFYAEGGKVYKEGDAENYYMAEEKEFVKYSMDGKKVAVLDYKDLKEAHNEAAWTQVDTDSKETEDAPTAGTTEEPAPSDKAAESTEIKTEYTKSEIKEKCTYSGTKKLKTPMMDIDVKMNASCPLDRAPQVTADVGEMKVGDQTIPAGSTIEIPKPEKGDIVGMSAMGKPTKYFIYDGSWDSDGVNGLKPIKVTA